MRHFIPRFTVVLFTLAVILASLVSAFAQAPVITAQPQSQTNVLGYPAAFSVTATGAAGYQWRKESALIPGATASTLTLASVNYAHAGNYSVLASNACGVVASSNATLTVAPPAAGELDFTFNPGSGVNDRLRSVVVQPDGKVLVGGSFTSVNGAARMYLGRFNADGSLDTSFLNGLSGADGEVWSTAVQADGKVLVGGLFTAINGVARNRIARLNADGSLDPSFQNGMAGANSFIY
jgi:uncharacterized delta-60 repeat protein